MHTILFWFRNDLRLQDQRALLQAAQQADRLLLVYVHDPAQDEATAWGFRRMGVHRRCFVADTLQDLIASLQTLGQQLVLLHGSVHEALTECARRVQAQAIFCEDIAAPEEQAQVQDLRSAGFAVNTVWQSSLLEPEKLPFEVVDMPQVFTAFRQRIEAAGVQPLPPLAAPAVLPPPPDLAPLHTLPGWTDNPWALLQVQQTSDWPDGVTKLSAPYIRVSSRMIIKPLPRISLRFWSFENSKLAG